MATLVEVLFVGRIGQRVGCRTEFPYILYYLADLPLLHLHHGACKQGQHVIEAERNAVHLHIVHYLKEQLAHLYLQSVAVATDDGAQGFRLNQLGIEPHTALPLGGELTGSQIMEECGYLSRKFP